MGNQNTASVVFPKQSPAPSLRKHQTRTPRLQNTDVVAPKPVQKPVNIPKKASTSTKQKSGNTPILTKLKIIISLKFGADKTS